MAETTPRVVVLARPGKAADNLAEALRQAGADLVAVADPAQLDEAALLAYRPQAILVALEPGIEAAVDALDEVLSAPGLTVIFDEADIAAQRAGWDSARWVRHLSAKLHRHQDVLPPGAEPDGEMLPTPGHLPTPASIHASTLDMAPFAREAEDRAGSLPVDDLRYEAVLPTPVLPPELSVELPVIDVPVIDLPVIEAPLPADAPMAVEAVHADTVFDISGFELESIPQELANEKGLQLVDLDEDRMDEVRGANRDSAVDVPEYSEDYAEEIDAGALNDDELRAFEQAMRGSARAQAEPPGDEAPAFDSSFLQELGFDPALLEPIAPDMATPAPGAESVHEIDFDFTRESPEPTATQPLAPVEPVQTLSAPGFSDFSMLSLVEDDAASPPSSPPAAPARAHDLGDLERRISGLSLVDIELDGEDSAEIEARNESTAAMRPYDAEPLPVAPVSDADSVLPTSPASSFAAFPPPVAPPIMPPAMPPVAMPPPLPSDTARSMFSPHPLPVAAPPSTQANSAIVRALVLVEAGLGGPDPVRQLLAGLPAGFSIPVVVRLQLQGGRYDRLVAQMERAASLPVSLAQPDQPLAPGRIHFLPEGVGLRRDGDSFHFDVAFSGPDSVYDMLETLDDGALVFLSGTDPSLVDRAVSLAVGGTFVVAQSPEDCYDGVACAQLRGRGVPTAGAPELAARLVQHWPY